ncbi:MAG: hypothetical protein ACTSR8_10185 [Promethearchaeota archaeon]
MDDLLRIKVVQGGKIEFFELDECTRAQKFKDLLFPLLKKYKIKKKDAFITTADGRLLSAFDYSKTFDEIVKKFGLYLKLYNEKQI